MHNTLSAKKSYNIIFLHHSVGNSLLKGGRLIFRPLVNLKIQKFFITKWFEKYNLLHQTNYKFSEQYFPKREIYGWNNYPYDYYNIWVKNASDQPYKNEPTLEILTKQYNLIIIKHCYPVGDILEDNDKPEIDSSEKRIENYKLQYIALRQKFLEFPDTKFMILTGAARVKATTTESKARRAKEFFDWVKNEWLSPKDNIFIFDFFELETEGTLYLKPEYAINQNDSHPNKAFAKRVAPYFCKCIVEVINQNKK